MERKDTVSVSLKFIPPHTAPASFMGVNAFPFPSNFPTKLRGQVDNALMRKLTLGGDPQSISPSTQLSQRARATKH